MSLYMIVKNETSEMLKKNKIVLFCEVANLQTMVNVSICYVSLGSTVLGDQEVTVNIYCKSRNLPNTDTQNYSTDLR